MPGAGACIKLRACAHEPSGLLGGERKDGAVGRRVDARQPCWGFGSARLLRLGEAVMAGLLSEAFSIDLLVRVDALTPAEDWSREKLPAEF
jgi:hypothetical protein